MGGNIKLVVVIDNTTCKVITNTNNSSSSTNKILKINNVASWGHLGGTIYMYQILIKKSRQMTALSMYFSFWRQGKIGRHKRQVSTLCTVQYLFWAFSPAWTPSFLPFYSLIGQSLLWLFTRLNFIGLDLFVHCKIYQSCQKLIAVTFLKD